MTLDRRLFTAGLAGAFAAGFAPRAWADAPALIRGVSVTGEGAAAHVAVALERPVQARTLFLADPHRFVIDMANARWLGAETGAGPGAGMVAGYRYAMRPDGSARLVLDLAGPAALARQEIGGRAAPELRFDLAAAGPIVAAPAIVRSAPRPRTGQRRTIVVDAGHGGHDPGAVGVTGVREKDVVLDAALKLRQALEARGQYRVALTRDADRFVELEERVRFARGQNADLFISLHADSNANREAAGASVYTLSERGAARAQSMMGSQNWEIDLGDAPRTGVVGNILVDLAQRETTNRSGQFAETVIGQLGGVAPLLRNTHRNASFFVLLAPDVPAVLVETGFLSNVADERRLSDPRARESMADAMAQAVDSFFTGPALMAGA